MKENVERDVVKKIISEMKGGIWNKIFFRLFKKRVVKIYKLGIKEGFNWNNPYVR